MIIRLTDTEIEEEDLYTMVQSLAMRLASRPERLSVRCIRQRRGLRGSGCGLTGHRLRPETVSET